MYRSITRIYEIRNVLTRWKVVESALDAIIVFLIVFLVLSFTGMNSIWALFLPPVLFFITALRFRADTDIIKLIEERYPALRERLGALYDNREEKNIVVEDLEEKVYSDMEQVRYSSFISMRSLGIRAAVILLLVAFVLSTTLINPPVIGRNTPFESPILIPERTGSGTAPDMFQEPSAVRIGNDSKGMIVYRGMGSELNVPGKGKQASGHSTLFPPGAEPSEIYEEGVPVMYQQIVKNYFANLSGRD